MVKRLKKKVLPAYRTYVFGDDSENKQLVGLMHATAKLLVLYSVYIYTVIFFI